MQRKLLWTFCYMSFQALYPHTLSEKNWLPLHILQAVVFLTPSVYHKHPSLSFYRTASPLHKASKVLALSKFVWPTPCSQSYYFLTHLLEWNLDLRSEKHKETENCLNPKPLKESRRLLSYWVKGSAAWGGGLQASLCSATVSSLQWQRRAPGSPSHLPWSSSLPWAAWELCGPQLAFLSSFFSVALPSCHVEMPMLPAHPPSTYTQVTWWHRFFPASRIFWNRGPDTCQTGGVTDIDH